jgi:hypothetical protein
LLSRAERDKPCSWESRTRRASDSQSATVPATGLPVNSRARRGKNVCRCAGTTITSCNHLWNVPILGSELCDL